MSFFLDTFTGALAYLDSHTPDVGGAQWVGSNTTAFTKYIQIDGTGIAFGVWNGSSPEPGYASALSIALPVNGVKVSISGQQDTPSAAQSWIVGLGHVGVGMGMDPAHPFTRNYCNITLTGVGTLLTVPNLDVSGPYTLEAICADGFQQITFNGTVVGSAAVGYGGAHPDATSVNLTLVGGTSGSGDYNTFTSLAVDPYTAAAPFWHNYVLTTEIDA